MKWQAILENDDRGALMSIWEGEPNDIWIVGGQWNKGFVLRGDGENFEDVSLPEGVPLLNWVHGINSSDVWVGGLFGAIYHYDGNEWTDYSLSREEAIWGIHALSSDSVMFVGGLSRWGGEKAFMVHYKDQNFEDLPLDAPLENLSNLFKVSHDGADFWSVGAQGALLKNTEAIPTGISTDLITITQSQQGLHVVGGRGTGIHFSIRDGLLGEVQQIPAGLNGVSSFGDSTLMVGERGYAILQEAGESLELEAQTLDVLHAALIDSQDRYFAVGGNLFTAEDSFHGVLLSYKEVP